LSIKKPLIINFLGGPGSLKSASASGIFSLLKLHYIDCELVTEYPKELTFEENWKALSMQGSVFGEQNRRLARIENKVAVVVTDTSLLLSLVYQRNTLTKEFEDYIMSVYNSYNNLNIYLTRNNSIKYEKFGRKQSKAEAIDIDGIIKSVLDQHKINYINLEPGLKTINKVTSIILNTFNKDLTFSIR